MKKFLNIINNSKVKMITILSFLLFIYTSLCAFSYAQNVSQDISNSVFRLHVIANSDTQEDQALKYIVRDKLIEYMNSLCTNCTSKEESIEIAKNNLKNFQEIAENTVKENGYSYSINVSIGNFEFPTKYYGDISLPAGSYDALKVEIGEAQGQNWWCVMFPPLCFVDISSGIVPDESKQLIKDNISEEEFALVSEDSNLDIQFKFKLLELFTKSGLITAKK